MPSEDYLDTGFRSEDFDSGRAKPLDLTPPKEVKSDSMSEFKVGDKITILTHHGRYPRSFSVVKDVTPRKVYLGDGSQWIANGSRRWGGASDQYYTGDYMRLTEPGDVEAYNRGTRLKRITTFQEWNLLSAEDLKTVSDIIRVFKVKEKDKV